VSPGRLRKRIVRSLKVSWREQPTRYDIAALRANVERVGLVVRVRWMLVGVLITYSLIGGAIYAQTISPHDLAELMAVPAAALAFVLLYNAFYQFNYRRLANIAVLNHLQLALDVIVVTVLVYYSGGITSWFWAMYSLFILEAAFILPTRRGAWFIAGLSAFMLGMVAGLEYFEILPHVQIPFSQPYVVTNATYVSVRYLWNIAVLAGTAFIATRFAFTANKTIGTASARIVDEQTGLYSRGFLRRALEVECARADRGQGSVHVIVADMDNFDDFNRRFGMDRGDSVLEGTAAVIGRALGEFGDLEASPNVAARYGGEEFALLLVDANGSPARTADALHLARLVRDAIRNLKVEGAGVTASVGVASFPADGTTGAALLSAADDALEQAVQAGGDRIATTDGVIAEGA